MNDVTATYQQSPGFFFPILKPAEIQGCLQDMGLEVSMDALTDPAHHKEKLREVFTFLVRSMYLRCVAAELDALVQYALVLFGSFPFHSIL